MCPVDFSLSKFTLNPVQIIRERVKALKRTDEDHAALHKAIRKSTAAEDGNLFDAVGGGVTKSLLRERERELKYEQDKVPVHHLHQPPWVSIII